jgi:hypothetical protein
MLDFHFSILAPNVGQILDFHVVDQNRLFEHTLRVFQLIVFVIKSREFAPDILHFSYRLLRIDWMFARLP